MLHRHVWKITHVGQSYMDRILDMKGKLTSNSLEDSQLMARKTVHYRCEKCGTEKVESI